MGGRKDRRQDVGVIEELNRNNNERKKRNMKIATIIARSLLGLIFVVFGSNMFLHFIPMPPPQEGPARDFMTALFVSHHLYVIGAL